MKHAYACALCPTTYDPTSQGHCPNCGRHPHLGDECDHNCDMCSSVAFPPKDGYLDLFQPVGSTGWRRVQRQGQP